MPDMDRNLFTLAFETIPTILAGRDTLLHEMHQALLQGTGDPNLSSILVDPAVWAKRSALYT
jgi:hypothetical protein